MVDFGLGVILNKTNNKSHKYLFANINLSIICCQFLLSQK